MKYLSQIFAFVLSMIGTFAVAFEGYDECSALKKQLPLEIKNLTESASLPWEISEDFGFQVWNEISEIPSGLGPFYAEARKKVPEEKYQMLEELWAYGFSAINGVSVEAMSLEQFSQELMKDTIDIKGRDSGETLTLEK